MYNLKIAMIYSNLIGQWPSMLMSPNHLGTPLVKLQTQKIANNTLYYIQMNKIGTQRIWELDMH